jgi:hypothetical protein
MTEEAQGMDGADVRLLAALREVAGSADPVPPAVVQAAKESLTWRSIDAELAELAYDSLLDDALLVGTRADTAPRSLTFEAADVVVEIEVVDTGAQRRLLGQLVPPRPADIQVRHSGGMIRVPADEVGRFSAAGVAAGPVSLRCRVSGHEDAPVETPWVVV